MSTPLDGVAYTDTEPDDITAHFQGLTGGLARRPWEDAGGSVPSLGGVIYGGTTKTGPDLGDDAIILSSFNRIGVECFATMRIHSSASGTTAGAGFTTIKGLPVAPKYVGSGADGGQPVGYGFLFDMDTGGSQYDLIAVIDPAFSLTEPLLFVSNRRETVDKAGDQDAAVWAPNNFGADSLVFVHGDLVAADFPSVSGAVSPAPFDLSQEFRLNLTFQYEGV